MASWTMLALLLLLALRGKLRLDSCLRPAAATLPIGGGGGNGTGGGGNGGNDGDGSDESEDDEFGDMPELEDLTQEELEDLEEVRRQEDPPQRRPSLHRHLPWSFVAGSPLEMMQQ